MRVSLNILIILIAWPALAYNPYSQSGWGAGNSNLVSVFYPPNDAVPRHIEEVGGTNMFYGAKETWVDDAFHMLAERVFWMYGASASEGASVIAYEPYRFDDDALRDIKDALWGMMTESQWIDLSNRSTNDLTYTDWFQSQSTNAIGQHPPLFDEVTVLEYNDLPTNFFHYTPARFLGATVVSFTNEHTASGGPLPDGRTEPWNTLDYGWEAVFAVIGSLQDLAFDTGGYVESREQITIAGDLLNCNAGETIIETNKFTKLGPLIPGTAVDRADAPIEKWVGDETYYVGGGVETIFQNREATAIIRNTNTPVSVDFALMESNGTFQVYISNFDVRFMGGDVATNYCIITNIIETSFGDLAGQVECFDYDPAEIQPIEEFTNWELEAERDASIIGQTVLGPYNGGPAVTQFGSLRSGPTTTKEGASLGAWLEAPILDADWMDAFFDCEPNYPGIPGYYISSHNPEYGAVLPEGGEWSVIETYHHAGIFRPLMVYNVDEW